MTQPANPGPRAVRRPRTRLQPGTAASHILAAGGTWSRYTAHPRRELNTTQSDPTVHRYSVCRARDRPQRGWDGYRGPVLALVLVALSLGLSNFAAAIGFGVAGADATTRVRVGVVFGIFEAGMPILGLALGDSLVSTLGHAARWAGAGLLIATGAYGLLQALRAGAAGAAGSPEGQLPLTRLLVTGLALSIDNLAVGFALGTYHVSLALAAVVIGAVSVVMSLAGLELGGRIGLRAGPRGELLGGLVLIGVGVAIGIGVV